MAVTESVSVFQMEASLRSKGRPSLPDAWPKKIHRKPGLTYETLVNDWLCPLWALTVTTWAPNSTATPVGRPDQPSGGWD